MLSRLTATAAALLALGGAAACTNTNNAADGKTTIVAGFYPLQFIAERIGGPDVTVTNLAKPGAEPHDLELNPQQVAQIADAAIVIYLKGFQPEVDKAVDQQAKDTSFDAAAVEPLLDATADGHGHEEEAAEPTPSPGGAAGDEKDPHVWLDPTRLATIADRFAERLGQVDSAHAADYRSRAAALRTELEGLDREYKTGLANCQRREIIVSHAAFGYLAERYDLEQIAITGITPEDEPTPQRLAEVTDEAREHQATTIFFETLVSPKVADAIARAVGAKTAVLDPLEGLEAGSTEDYLSVMRTNLATLRPALGCA